MRLLSHLELTVLGLVSTGAPCTPYWIRRQFERSLSSLFSGSAGAVYPAIRRLERRGLVVGAPLRRGSREAREYRLTERGEEALRDWLLPPLRDQDIAFTVDPVRSCTYFLGILAPEERLAFVDDAIARSRRLAVQVAAGCESPPEDGPPWEYAGDRGVLHQLEARIRWLEELKELLALAPPGDRADDGA